MPSLDVFLEHFYAVLFTALVCLLIYFPYQALVRFDHYTVYKITLQRDHRYRLGFRFKMDNDYDANVRRIDSFELDYEEQLQSPLFGILPSEVRDMIYEYAFADYEDLTRPYDLETCYRRPGYMAPRKTDTALLRTCQAAYFEAWYMPWTASQHTFYLAWDGRKPSKTTEISQMARASRLIEKIHPDVPRRRKEVSHVQVFAQLLELEPGNKFNKILSIPHFHPRTVTVTVRHTDIWNWEFDEPIHVATWWVSKARLPASVTCLKVQFESSERRKLQIDYVAEQAKAQWFFIRTDGTHLVPIQEPSALRWTGSSTWEGKRWIRDEEDQYPGMLQYYAMTVTFSPASKFCDGDENQHNPNHKRNSTQLFDTVEMPDEIASKTTLSIPWDEAAYSTEYLKGLGASKDMPASEVVRIIWEDRERQREEQQRLASRARRERKAAARQQVQESGGMAQTGLESALGEQDTLVNLDNLTELPFEMIPEGE